MRYINKAKKQLIIDTPIYRSITKTKTKDGQTKEHVKYIAHIPNDILIYLLDKDNTYDPKHDDTSPGKTENINDNRNNSIKYIDAMLNGDDKHYLSFSDVASPDGVRLSVIADNNTSDDVVNVTIKKQSGVNSYFFTVSKKVFSELKNCDDADYKFRYVIDFNNIDDCLVNSFVFVKLV